MTQRLSPDLPILIVDDEEHFLDTLEFLLGTKGFNNIIRCQDSREVTAWLEKQDFSLVILDVRMPHISGGKLLPQITGNFPSTPVIVVTGLNDIETSVECMKAGAFDFLVKPIESTRLITILRHALKQKEIEKENVLLKKHFFSMNLENPEVFSEIITHSKKMHSILKYIEVIARSPMPLLITGETGVGKELIARAVHKVSSPRSNFIAVNIAGLDDNLFTDTLFGHKKGGFTGADRDRKGLIEQAQDGTLFLDEIGDLSMSSQVKLLRLIQDKQYYPIGADTPVHTNARIIVATNRDLKILMKKKEFRTDLFYRLQTHHIHVPPLREKKEDLPLLVEHFLKKAAKVLNKRPPTPPQQLFHLLATYHFPGNIRELESIVFDAVSRHQGGVLSMSTFRQRIQAANVAAEPLPQESPLSNLSPQGAKIIFLDPLPKANELEKYYLEEAINRAQGNYSLAAQITGLKRKTFSYRLKKAREIPL